MPHHDPGGCGLIAAAVGSLRAGGLLPEILFDRQDHHHHRQGHQHQNFQDILRDQQGDPGADDAAHQGSHGGDQRDTELDPAAFQIAKGGGPCADGIDDLVGAHGHVSGQACHEIGGQRDEAAAPGHAVHKAP